VIYRSREERKPWFKRRVQMGRACMKGPSFWCSASNSVRYWLKKKKQKQKQLSWI